jgi:hypothetical protein
MPVSDPLAVLLFAVASVLAGRSVLRLLRRARSKDGPYHNPSTALCRCRTYRLDLGVGGDETLYDVHSKNGTTHTPALCFPTREWLRKEGADVVYTDDDYFVEDVPDDD